MYATVRTYDDGTALVDALVANEDIVRDLIGGISGFRAYYMLRTDGGAVSVSVFDGRGGAEESNRVAAEWIATNLPDLAVSPPGVWAGEVVISM